MSESRNIVTTIRWIISLLGILLGFWIGMLDPPVGLTVPAMRVIGVTVSAVIWWITAVIPEYASAIMMCVCWVLFGGCSFEQAFTVYQRPVWWVMVVAFAFGHVAGRTGLMKRAALGVLSIFPPTFKGQVWGLIGSGCFISPFIPSINAKGALSAPLAQSISDMLGFERKSNPCCGLFGASFVGYNLSSSIFLTGTTANFLMLGLMPAEYQNVTWLDWFMYSLVWGAIVMLALGFVICLLYKPAEEVRLPSDFAKKELEKCGPWSRDEKFCAAIMLGTLALWMTEPWHNIQSGTVGVGAMALMLCIGTMTRNDFKSGVDWPGLFFIGSLLNMASIVGALKIDKYLGAVLNPIFATFDAGPAGIIITMIAMCVILKFGIVSISTAAVIVFFAFVGGATHAGMHPWILACILFAASNFFMLPYMNSVYIAAHYATKGEMVDPLKIQKLAWIYIVILTIAALVSIPYWKVLGLIK